MENVANASASDDFCDFGGGISIEELLIARDELIQRVEEGDLHLRERAESHGHRFQFLSSDEKRTIASHFLGFELVYLRDDRRQAQFDVVQQQLIQFLPQIPRSVHLRDRRIPRSQELLLVPPLLRHALPRVDILLPAVNHAHIPQSQRNHAIRQNIERVRAPIHQIQLRNHAHRAQTLRIHFSRHLDRVAVRQIRIRGRYRHDNAVRLANELQNHPANDHLDVLRLVPYRHSTVNRGNRGNRVMPGRSMSVRLMTFGL